ncbi:MAG: hypothetical protein NTY65_05595 [Planctomycetota bacterium]|nr:hypothetical protein [Planctomycetota bacterium]
MKTLNILLVLLAALTLVTTAPAVQYGPFLPGQGPTDTPPRQYGPFLPGQGPGAAPANTPGARNGNQAPPRPFTENPPRVDWNTIRPQQNETGGGLGGNPAFRYEGRPDAPSGAEMRSGNPGNSVWDGSWNTSVNPDRMTFRGTPSAAPPPEHQPQDSISPGNPYSGDWTWGTSTEAPWNAAGDAMRRASPTTWDKILGIPINREPLLQEDDSEIPYANDLTRAAGAENAFIKEMRNSGFQMRQQGAISKFLGLARWYNRGVRIINATWQRGIEGGMHMAAIEFAKWLSSQAVRAAYASMGVPAIALIADTTCPIVAVPLHMLLLAATYENDEHLGRFVDEQLVSLDPRPNFAHDPNGRPIAPRTVIRGGPGRPIAAPTTSGSRTSGTTSGGGCAGGCPPASLGGSR